MLENIITPDNYTAIMISCGLAIYILAGIAIAYKQKYCNLSIAAIVVMIIVTIIYMVTLIAATPYMCV